MRGGVSPSSAAESPCRPSCSEPRARTVARMVCGTPSTNSPAEACALAVPVAQISPQLWAETHCLGNRGTQHISLLRLDSSVNRYGRPAWIRGKYPVNKYLNLCAHANQSGLRGPGPDKIRRKRGLEKAHKRKTQPRELKKRIVELPGFPRIFHVREPEKISTSDSPKPTEILAAPGVRRDREARLWIDGGTARVSFTDRE